MGNEPEWTHRRRWSPDHTVVAEAREFVSTHLALHELPQLVADAALVVSELATNSVVHARTPFEVTLQRTNGTVLLQVSDESPRRPVARTQRTRSTAGRGLLLVEELGDSWGVLANLAGGKAVWVAFQVRT